MKNKSAFKVTFVKPDCGWSNFIMKHKNQRINISISGVYNPFYDLNKILVDLSKNKKKTYVLEIDSEGYLSFIHFSHVRNKIKIYYTCESNRRNIHEDVEFLVQAKVFFKEFNFKISTYRRKQNMFGDTFYDLRMPTRFNSF